MLVSCNDDNNGIHISQKFQFQKLKFNLLHVLKNVYSTIERLESEMM